MSKSTTARIIYNTSYLAKLSPTNRRNTISELQRILQATAVEINQDFSLQKCWYVFEDGSAIGIDSYDEVYIKTNYGRNVDHQSIN